jgi:predicted RNase H-like HicB family nuclease
MKKKPMAATKKQTKRSAATAEHYAPAEHYLYTVGWSEDDEAYVARVAEFPSLAAHGDSQEIALCSLHSVVKAVVKDLAASNEQLPQPSA